MVLFCFVQCSYGECHITFHPWCARGAGFYMNARGLGGVLQHKAYCAKHSTEKKEVKFKLAGIN
jgi:PHD-like zinc-binding domain